MTTQLVVDSEARVNKRIDSLPSVDEFRETTAREMSQLKHQIESITSTTPSSPEIDVTSLEPILTRVDDLSRSLSELTNLTMPQFMKEIDTSLVSTEYKLEQKTVQLLQDLCVEFDSDINRLVELVHSVYVQANLTMPPGTLTSWKKFKEIMFDINPDGVRRPILGEAVLNHLGSSGTPRTAKKPVAPGRLFSRS